MIQIAISLPATCLHVYALIVICKLRRSRLSSAHCASIEFLMIAHCCFAFCATCVFIHTAMYHSRELLSLLTNFKFLSHFAGRIQWPEELDLDLSAELMNSNQYSKWVWFDVSWVCLTSSLICSANSHECTKWRALKRFNWRFLSLFLESSS